MANAAHQKNMLFIGEYGPIIVHEEGQLTYGEVIRFLRKRYTLSPELIAELYGRVAEGDPVTGRHVLRMEQQDSFFPKDPNRRWILAQLLSLPPALMELVTEEPSEPIDEHKKLLAFGSTKTLDTEEYYKTLKSYWVDGYRYLRGKTYAIKDTKRRIARLQQEVLYPSTTNSKQQEKMARLLCGYLIVLAEIAREEECYPEAKNFLINAFNLAREKNLYDFQGIVLVRRHVLFYSAGFDPFLGDFETGEQLRTLIAPQIQGRLLTRVSMSQAHFAQDQDAFGTVLKGLDNAEKLVGPASPEDFLFFTGLDSGCYLLDRAVTLVESSIKRLRSPDKAQEFLDLAIKENHERGRKGKSVQAYHQIDYDLIQARIYYDQGYYPTAAVTAEQVLVTLNNIQSKVGLYKITGLIKDLKEHDPYGEDVISLQMAFIKTQRPYLFA